MLVDDEYLLSAVSLHLLQAILMQDDEDSFWMQDDEDSFWIISYWH